VTATPSASSGSGVARPPSGTGGGQKVASPGGGVPGRPGSGGGPGKPGGGGGSAPSGGMPPIDQLQGRPIGRVLTKMGKVTREQVIEALNFQKSKGGAVGRILIDLGYVKESDLNVGLAAQKGYELFNLEGLNIPPAVIAAVPAQIATTNKVLPIEFDPATKKITIVMATQDNFRAVDDLQSLMGYKVTAKIGDPEQIDRLIQKYYQATAESLGEILGELTQDDSLKDLKGRGESIDLDSLKEAADSNPVRKLINLVLLQAIKDKASDIHFEPFEDEFKMRYRIDGVLYEMMPPPAHIAPAISSRIKVMANLDIAERRMPQDGRIELSVNNQPIDLRVSVLPTMFGESVVMRVLDRGNVNLDLDKLGIREDDLTQVRQLIHRPNGVVIVTGPTGSGKTTTLYSALRELNDVSSKLITAEDPVEYDIDGIIQCQIKAEIEMTFARILRSMLRQDPDIILVGEIRDQETAKIAVDRSSAGSGPGAVPRHRIARRGHRPAAGAKNLPQLQGRIQADGRTTHGAGASAGGCGGARLLLWKRMRFLQQHRLPGPAGIVRDHDFRRRDARYDHSARQHANSAARSQKARHANAAPVRPDGHLRRRHHHRRSGAGNGDGRRLSSRRLQAVALSSG
jgi:type IV pilus assembly protein PilB